MTSLHICVSDCTASYKTKRFNIPLSKVKEQTDSLLNEICKEIGSRENEIEVVYCGQKVDRGMALGTLNLAPQATLFVFRKPPPAAPATVKSSLQMASEMMPLINGAMQRPNYKKTVDHIMTSPESLQKLLTAVPGLDQDPTAMSMLQDPELLQILAHRTNIHKVLKQHPLFGAAAVYVAKIVDEEHSRDPPARSARNNFYSLDRMSDEEDEGGAQQPRAAPMAHPQITASQVAAALAAATASASAAQAAVPGSSSGATAGSSGAQGSAPGMYPPDLMQQRMMSAQNSALEAQLQQLRDMGITDENMARQALSATNGDLHAALDIIFGDEASS